MGGDEAGREAGAGWGGGAISERCEQSAAPEKVKNMCLFFLHFMRFFIALVQKFGGSNSIKFHNKNIDFSYRFLS